MAATPPLGAPGVYVVEVPSGVHTLTGVATSICAFFGRAAKGPLDTAVHVLSPSDFTRAFGPPHPDSDLAQSVRMFFENGGSDCYVVRLASGAQAAKINLKSLDGKNVLLATAKSPGVLGNGLKLEVSYGTALPDETFNLTIIQEDNGQEIDRETFNALSMDPALPNFAPDFVTVNSSLIALELHADSKPGGAYRFDAAGEQLRRVQPEPRVHDHTDRRVPHRVREHPHDHAGFRDQRQRQPGHRHQPGDGARSGGAGHPPRIGVVARGDGNAAGAGHQRPVEQRGHGPRRSRSRSRRQATRPRFALRSSSGLQRSVRIRRAASGGQGLRHARRCSGWTRAASKRRGTATSARPRPRRCSTRSPTSLPSAALTRDQIVSIAIDGEPPIAFSFAALTPLPADLWTLDSKTTRDGIREKLLAIVQAINNTAASSYRAELWGYRLALLARSGSPNKMPASVVSAPTRPSAAPPSPATSAAMRSA